MIHEYVEEQIIPSYAFFNRYMFEIKKEKLLKDYIVNGYTVVLNEDDVLSISNILVDSVHPNVNGKTREVCFNWDKFFNFKYNHEFSKVHIKNILCCFMFNVCYFDCSHIRDFILDYTNIPKDKTHAVDWLKEISTSPHLETIQRNPLSRRN
jgi:hypothetical protein